MVNFEIPVNANGKKLGSQRVDFSSQKDVIKVDSKSFGSPSMEVDLSQKRLKLNFDESARASLTKFQEDFPGIEPAGNGCFEFEISAIFMDAKENIQLKIAGADTTFSVSANNFSITSGKQTSTIFSSDLNSPVPEFFDINFNENFLETIEFSRNMTSKTPEEKLLIEFSSLPIQMFEKLKSSTNKNISTFSFGEGEKYKFVKVNEQYFIARGNTFKPLPQNKLPVQDCVVYSEYEKDKYQIIFGMNTNEKNEITDGIGLKNLSEEDIKAFKKFFNSENVKTKDLGEQVIVAKQMSSHKLTSKTAEITEETKIVFPEEMIEKEIIPGEEEDQIFNISPNTDGVDDNTASSVSNNLPSVPVKERSLSPEVRELVPDDVQEIIPEKSEEINSDPAPSHEENASTSENKPSNDAPQEPKQEKKEGKKEPDFKGDALKLGMSLGKIAGAATIIASFAFPPLLFVGGLLYFGGFCSNDVVDTISTVLKYCHSKQNYKKVTEKKEKSIRGPEKVDKKAPLKSTTGTTPPSKKTIETRPEGKSIPVLGLTSAAAKQQEADSVKETKTVSDLHQEVLDEEVNLSKIYEMFSTHTIKDETKKRITEYDKKVEEDLKVCNAKLEKDPTNAELAAKKQDLLDKKEFYDAYYNEISKEFCEYVVMGMKKTEAYNEAMATYNAYHDEYSDYHIEQQKEFEKKKAVREEALRHMKVSRQEAQRIKAENEKQAVLDAEERDKKLKEFEAEKANVAKEQLLKVKKLQAEQIDKLRTIKEKATAFINILSKVLGFDKDSDQSNNFEK